MKREIKSTNYYPLDPYVESAVIDHTYRVSFKDGNKKLLGAQNIVEVINYLVYDKGYSAEDIWKVEEVE